MKKLVLLLLVAILLSACQSAATPQPTAIPPTNPPAPTPTSAPVEALAGSVNDIIGAWWFPKMGIFEFKADGTSRVFVNGDTAAELNYTFDNGKVIWAATGSCKNKPATYEAYVAKQDGKPIWLRMQVVGSDPCSDRANALSSKGKFQNP
jgi:hypothetical protein